MRTKSPIFTTRAILDETGFIMEETTAENDSTADDADSTVLSDNSVHDNDDDSMHKSPRLEQYSVEELEKMLSSLIQDENYEEAAKVAQIIKEKKDGSDRP